MSVNSTRCSRCSRVISGDSAFLMAGKVRCLRCAATHAPLLYRSAKTSVVVGTILIAINVGPSLLAGDFQADVAWKIPLNYIVPFCVATWGALSNSRSVTG